MTNIQGKKLLLTDYFLFFGIILMVGLMALPLSVHAVNALILFNLLISAAFLALSLAKKPIFFHSNSISLVLLATLFRLTVNVSVSRLVLNGQDSIFKLIGAWGVLPDWKTIAIAFAVISVLMFLQFFYIKKITMNISNFIKNNKNCLETNPANVFYSKQTKIVKFIQNEAIANLLLMLINCFVGFYIAVFHKSVMPWLAINYSLSFTILAAAFYLIPSIIQLIATNNENNNRI